MRGPLPFLGMFLALAALLLALAFPPSVYGGSLALILLGFGAAHLLLSERGLQRNWAPALLVTVGWVLSVAFASYVHAALTLTLTALLYLAAWEVGRAGGRRLLRAAAWTLAAVGALAAAHGIYQVLFGLEESAAAARAMGAAPEVMQRLRGGRAFSRFPLPAQLGAFLVFCLPVTGWVWVEARRRAKDAGPGSSGATLALGGTTFLLFLQTAGLLTTLSLGAFAAGAVACLYLVWVRWRSPGRLLPILGILALGGLLALALRPELAAMDHPDHPIGLRLANWKVALSMVRDHWALGVGPGCFGVRYPGYMAEGMNATLYAHSVPLQILAELGIWSVAPLLLAAVALGRRVLGAKEDLLLATAVVAFGASNLWDFHFYLPSLALPFLLVAGSWTASPPEETREASPPGGRRWALGLALCVAAIWVTAVEGSRSRTESALAAGRLQEAEGHAIAWQGLSPLDADPLGVRSELGLWTGADHGLAFALEAARLDPWTPFRHAVVSDRAERAGDPGLALSSIYRAHRLFPLRSVYRERWERLRASAGGETP